MLRRLVLFYTNVFDVSGKDTLASVIFMGEGWHRGTEISLKWPAEKSLGQLGGWRFIGIRTHNFTVCFSVLSARLKFKCCVVGRFL